MKMTGGESIVACNVGEDHAEGITVYNMEVDGAHTYFVRTAHSEAKAVWVHNANYKGADPSLRLQGERFRGRAQELWHILPQGKRYGATIAVSEIEGTEIVSLYANRGRGPNQFSQAQIDQFIRSVEDAGGVGIHTFGKVHAEVVLHQQYPAAPAIGISNPNGPCPSCMEYFLPRGYRKICYPD